MQKLWQAIQRGYLRVIEPVADFLVRHRVRPNTITTIGTVCTVVAGVIFATGHIRTAGWFLGLTALFDVLDGTVARRTGRSTLFGAFYDSTLDRVSDGVVLGGLVVFYATSEPYGSVPLLVITLLGLIGTFLTSYTRARAEGLGLNAKVGLLQRPERVTLLSAPQAFFGLALDGWVLAAIVTLLSVTAWITAVQRIHFVYTTTTAAEGEEPTTTGAARPAASAGAGPSDPAAPGRAAPGDVPPRAAPVGSTAVGAALVPEPRTALNGE